MVVSDGLSANAVNEQLRFVLPRLRHMLAASGCAVVPADVVVRNGRVRVGYEIGALRGAEVVVHLIGERPGTGLNAMSAYLTYGRDQSGQLRWTRALDHSATTAICGIHPRGKAPEAAVDEIARVVARILAERRSGVSLGAARA
jgi:ethanolamine ammonia-lyase small subunit